MCNNYFFVKDVLNDRFVRIISADLITIEGNGNFVFLYLADLAKPIMTNLSMTAVAERAWTERIVRVHKQYMVNLAHVLSLRGNEITVPGNRIIPLSRRLRVPFLKCIGQAPEDTKL